MSLTILSVAFPFAPVTSDPAGGSEQVLAAIDRALVSQGHRSVVIACDGSSVSGELCAVPVPAGRIDEASRADVHIAVRARIDQALGDERPDVIHLHGLDFADYLPAPGPPVLATLHLPLDWYAPGALRSGRPRTWLQPVSDDQARRAPPDVALTQAISNGVDTERHRPAAKADHLLVLGRIAPEKGFHDAVEAARLAGVPLVVAGSVFPYAAHERYFDEEVAPRLDEYRRFVGPVQGITKQRLLASARGVLIPSTAPETSSLVAMEALASGTPVIAYRSGALPGIVEHGRTGFIVDTVADMAAAIGCLDSIDSTICRAEALARFPVERMTDAYLDRYRQLAA